MLRLGVVFFTCVISIVHRRNIGTAQERTVGGKLTFKRVDRAIADVGAETLVSGKIDERLLRVRGLDRRGKFEPFVKERGGREEFTNKLVNVVEFVNRGTRLEELQERASGRARLRESNVGGNRRDADGVVEFLDRPRRGFQVARGRKNQNVLLASGEDVRGARGVLGIRAD